VFWQYRSPTPERYHSVFRLIAAKRVPLTKALAHGYVILHSQSSLRPAILL
jgi:hypothetical protein